MTITYSAIDGLRRAWKRAMGDAKMADHGLDHDSYYRRDLKDNLVFFTVMASLPAAMAGGLVFGSLSGILGAVGAVVFCLGSIPYLHANYKCGEVQHERKLALEAEQKRLALLPPPPKPLA